MASSTEPDGFNATSAWRRELTLGGLLFDDVQSELLAMGRLPGLN